MSSPSISFFGTKAGEHVQLLVRKHWITDVRSVLALLLIGFLPFLVGLWVLITLWERSNGQVFWVGMMIFLAYILFISLITYIHWLNDELDIIVVTDQRIISHEQVDLFHRRISETNVAQVEDVKGVEKGFLQSLLHYGTLEIMTASKEAFFEIDYVARPYENARLILDMRDKFLTKNNDE